MIPIQILSPLLAGSLESTYKRPEVKAFGLDRALGWWHSPCMTPWSATRMERAITLAEHTRVTGPITLMCSVYCVSNSKCEFK